MNEIYDKLARHLEHLVMGYPYNEHLPALLAEMFSPDEACVAMAIPTALAPLRGVNGEEIAKACQMPHDQVLETLAAMAERGMIFSGPTESGETGYSLLQIGYGVPQAFFWGGKEDETARTMAKRVLKYFTVETTGKVYGGVETKSYRYAPSSLAVTAPLQGALPGEAIRPIVEAAKTIAVAHCPCRMSAKLLGRDDCPHPLEVCLKYDELAEFVIRRGLARRISKEEALEILEMAERAGLVHMVDNAAGEVKHTCNCCGCYCWNVGIIRRRKIPRDQLMASYFLRRTDLAACVGCGACQEICPVDAVKMDDDGKPAVDLDWCIGCGVCAVACPTDAIELYRRRQEPLPADFLSLHREIADQKKAAKS